MAFTDTSSVPPSDTGMSHTSHAVATTPQDGAHEQETPRTIPAASEAVPQEPSQQDTDRAVFDWPKWTSFSVKPSREAVEQFYTQAKAIDNHVKWFLDSDTGYEDADRYRQYMEAQWSTSYFQKASKRLMDGHGVDEKTMTNYRQTAHDRLASQTGYSNQLYNSWEELAKFQMQQQEAQSTDKLVPRVTVLSKL